MKSVIQYEKRHFDKTIVTDVEKNDAWENMGTWNNPGGFEEKIQAIEPHQVKYLKKGVKHLYCSDADVLMQTINDDVKNTLVVMEDGSKYFDEGRMTRTQKKIVLDTKQKNIDLVILFHGISFIPKKLIKVCIYIHR